MMLFFRLFVFLSASYWLLVNVEPRISTLAPLKVQAAVDSVPQDILLTNLHLTLSPDRDPQQSSELWAQSAEITPQGLKMYFIDGSLLQHQKTIALHAQDAFWPFDQKVIYFFDDLSVEDGDLSMLTSTLSYHFEDKMVVSNNPTYWKTEDMTIINHEIKNSADDIKRMFFRSS